MRESLLNFLSCPNCGSESIQLEIVEVIKDEIVSGVLTCNGCLTRFPIISGIPSMLPKSYVKIEKDVSNLSLASSVDFIQQSEMIFRDNHANVYDNLPSAQAQLEIEFVLDELKLDLQKGYNILDLGCGTGRALLSLVPYSATLVGVDFSLESLYLLKSKIDAVRNAGDVHLIHGDAAHPPLRNSLFDTITCVQLLQSFPDINTRLAVLKQVRRVARPEARFVLSVFYYSLLKKMRAKAIKDPAQDVYEREGLHLGTLYYHNYTGQEITELLRQSGFKVLKKRGVNTPLTRRFGFVGAKIEKLLKWSGVFTPISHWITVSAVLKNDSIS